MKRIRSTLLIAAALVATLSTSASAGNREERVRFARGASSAVIRGEVRGYDYVDYLVGARAGQHLTADLSRVSGPAYFLVRAPGSEDNLFDGATTGDHFETVLPATGDYRLRVFLMRSAARRNERAAYRLSVAIR
jgi:hypothetical protein